MIYTFLDPLNEVRVDGNRNDKCIPVSTPAGILPLIVLGHLEERHNQRMKPFVSKYPQLDVPWKTILSNYIKNLNKEGFKKLKTVEDQFISRTYIDIVDADGKFLGRFECGVVGKYAGMIGKPNQFFQDIMDKYKIKRDGRILSLETYVCLATKEEEMWTFRGKAKTTYKNNKYKQIVMTKEQMDELEDFSIELIRGTRK